MVSVRKRILKSQLQKCSNFNISFVGKEAILTPMHATVLWCYITNCIFKYLSEIISHAFYFNFISYEQIPQRLFDPSFRNVWKVTLWMSQCMGCVQLRYPIWGRAMHLWGMLCQKKISRAGTSYCIPQILWDAITCPCPGYLFLAQYSCHNSVNFVTVSSAKPLSPARHQTIT